MATPERPRDFTPRPFPISPSARCIKYQPTYPSGKKGGLLTVEFTVMGIPCIGLNGGPDIKHKWAFSFQVATADQAETDRYWNAIITGAAKRANVAGAKTNGV